MRKTCMFRGEELSKYECDENGLIYRKGSNQPLYQGNDMRGYLAVVLMSNDGKVKLRCKVHSIIAETFIGPRPAGAIVEHKNLNKHDNRVVNLEYISQRENVARAQVSVKKKRYLSLDEVNEIKNMIKKGDSFREIAEKMDLPFWVIRDIAIGKTYSYKMI